MTLACRWCSDIPGAEEERCLAPESGGQPCEPEPDLMHLRCGCVYDRTTRTVIRRCPSHPPRSR